MVACKPCYFVKFILYLTLEKKWYGKDKKMNGIIEVQNLSKTFETDDGKVEALQNISLSIQAGDIYGIIGMSGAGKSTLVRC